MECKICLKKYNLLDRKPATIVACNHTYCLRCMFSLKVKNKKCPECQIEIKKCLPNYALIELIETKNQSLEEEQNLNKTLMLQFSQTYYSPNHEHTFKRSMKNTAWICDGDSIFGACKSGLTDGWKSIGVPRYRCTVCPDFDLCHLCLNSAKFSDRLAGICHHSFLLSFCLKD